MHPRHFSHLALRTIACLLVALLIAPPAAAANRFDDDSDLSELEIFFKVVKGKIQVNRETSRFNSSERFTSRLSRNLSVSSVAKELFDDIDKALNKNQKVFVYSLPTAIRAQYETDEAFRLRFETQDEETKAVSDFDSPDWSLFDAAYERWHTKQRTTIPTVLPLTDSLRAQLRLLPASLNNTPLSFDVRTDSQSDIDDTGTIKVHVADPIDLTKADEYEIEVPVEDGDFPHKDKITPTAESVREALAPLKGQLWRSERIRRYLMNFFVGSDYPRAREEALDSFAPGFHVDEAVAPPKRIQIGKVRRIARIDFVKFDDTVEAIDLILRQLLNDASFKTFVRKQYAKEEAARPIRHASAENLLSFHYVYLEALTGKDHEPHFSPVRFLSYAAALSRLGYTISVGPYDPETDTLPGGGPVAEEGDGRSLYLRLLIQKKSDATDSSSDRGESVAAHASASQTPSPTPSPSPSPSPAPKQKKNFAGGELVYKPDQGVKFYGIYKRFGLLNRPNGDGDLTVKVGNRDEHFIVTGDFSADNLWFNKLHRRLSVDLVGESDFEVRRQFFNVETDERRQFASIRGDLEIFTRPTHLAVFVEARGGTVELIQNETSISKQRLNILSFGGTYVRKTDQVVPLRSLQLEPTIRFGLGLAQNEPTYSLFSFRGTLQHHRDLPARFGIHIAGRFDVASKDTPIFELPSFGGVDSVRGFREDDAIGRRMWSIQNEVRLPIFGLKPDVEGFVKTFMRNQLKLAAFIDVGAAYDTVGTEPGLRAGPGMGLRLNFQGVNLKLDYAYGIGDAAVGRGRGRFHFSVETPLRF